MKKLFALVLLASSAASSYAAGGRLNTWLCFLDVKETRWQRDGDPMEGRGQSREGATDAVFAACEAFHSGHYPGLCDEYRARPSALACQRSAQYEIPW